MEDKRMRIYLENGRRNSGLPENDEYDKSNYTELYSLTYKLRVNNNLDNLDFRIWYMYHSLNKHIRTDEYFPYNLLSIFDIFENYFYLDSLIFDI